MSSSYYIGLISGTSADAIDAVLVQSPPDNFQLLATHCHPLPKAYRQDILHLSQSTAPVYPWRIARLEQLTADLLAEAVAALLQKTDLTFAQIQAIGSHGQTLYHLAPQQASGEQVPFTWQIGDPSRLAYRTGIPVVADFRRKDMAAGGQGAPLAPAFHAALFQTQQETRIILNSGGIANITLLPADKSQAVLGFDTGPANGLMDAWIARYLGKDYDANGDWAASGSVQTDLLQACLRDPYFALPAPKSTGKDYFNLTWLDKHLAGKHYAPQDVQATLLQLSVASIGEAIRAYSAQRLLVCGGGAHNRYFMQQLPAYIANIEVQSSADYGLAPDWVEACCFAWLAQQRCQGLPGNVPSVTGAAQALVLGGLYLP